MFRVEKLKRKCKLHIEGEMTIYHAGKMKDQLIELLDDKRDLEINLANVTEIDSAGVQVLMMAKKECTRRNRTLTLTNHSNSVCDIFELLGLVSYFNDPLVLPGN